MKKLILIIATLVTSTSATSSPQRDFNKVDTDNNGNVSLVEFLKHVPEGNVDRMTGFFIKRDKDKSGYLTKAEYLLNKNKNKNKK